APDDPKAKVSFRTAQNAIALLPPDEAASVAPEKIVVLSYDKDGVPVATRFRIDQNIDTSSAPAGAETAK
ncbi:MAG TPA: hypothetical protein VFG14_03735, partial [Chthoniobacteraceae bacterium]|nr:hypothetical protein [Chthoniobacteraceae bacterium]